ncbi:hypothetical protein [Enterovibrio coralii]|uniref:TetR family transcriptional regulator n=1 Tax=Enterovibrio coralii TaxID=294935 RepID=A0A135I8J2_9GAMM|nr:hypothetical protein [Enterovibrio coralii]KXF81737.1 TetR family transcriptional regulator [Enterovibrio coralii]
MVKIAVIVALIVLGFLAAKFLDEKSQKKVVVGMGVVAGIAFLVLVVSELLR